MDQQLNISENVESLFRSLEDFTQREGIIGKPVTQGDKTFLPVVSITLGYGGGNANMKGQNGGSSAAGSGMSSATGTGAMGPRRQAVHRRRDRHRQPECLRPADERGGRLVQPHG